MTRNKNLPTPKETAQAEYDQLEEFIKKMKGGINERLNIFKQLTELVNTFQDIAKMYFNQAKSIINDGAAESDEYDYAQVLSHLRTHALLLGELIRNYPVKIFSTNQRKDFQRAFILISRRLKVLQQKTPILLPILTPGFRYSHFKYMDGFGFIGLPPEMSISNPNTNHLGALWHEVAGHAVAVARKSPGIDLNQWASNLQAVLKGQSLWEQYHQLYRENILSYLPKRKELEAISFNENTLFSEFKTLYTSHIVTDTIIDGDSAWQVTWLLEFVEDLFFYMVIKEHGIAIQQTAVNAMFTALSKRYPNPQTSDPLHPPAYLRLLVVIAYLSNGGDMATLNQDLELPTDWYDLAKTIAAFCHAPLNALFDNSGSYYEQEKEFAQIILKESTTWRRVHETLKGIDPTFFTDPADGSFYKLNDLEQEIRTAKTIADLLKIKFNYDDQQSGDPGGGPSSFPPPPP